MTFQDFLGLILACGAGILAYFLKRMVEALDRISEDIGVIKTSIAVHEEKHTALEKRVENLEKP